MYLVSLYNGKNDKSEYLNFRGITFLIYMVGLWESGCMKRTSDGRSTVVWESYRMCESGVYFEEFMLEIHGGRVN